MKTKIIIIFSVILLTCLYVPSGFSQTHSRKEIFNTGLKFDNLSYSLPNGFIEIDTTMSKKYFLFFDFRYINHFQIQSINKNIMIYSGFINYSKKAEDNLKKMYPNRNIDIKNDHLNVIRKLISENNSQSMDKISFNEKDIDFYGHKDLKRLGADIAGDFTMKLTTPYEGKYNYVTFRFIGKSYKLWIYTYIFYIEFNPKIAKETLKKTLLLFKFNN